MIKETWITPHEAVERFGWTFLARFDGFKSVPTKAANKRECTFFKYHRGKLERKKIPDIQG